jgi:hypothetical protein
VTIKWAAGLAVRAGLAEERASLDRSVIHLVAIGRNPDGLNMGNVPPLKIGPP